MRKLFTSLFLVFALTALAISQSLVGGNFEGGGQGVVRRAAGGGASSLLTGLVSYWALEEASGSRADSVGSNTLALDCCNSPTNATGIIGNGASFAAASTQAIQAVDHASLDFTTAFSVSIWINQTAAVAADRTLFAKWFHDTQGTFVCTTYGTGANLIVFIAASLTDGGDNYGFTTDAAMAADALYHVTVVYDGTLATNADRLKIYINATQKTLTLGGTIPASLPNSTASFDLGIWLGLNRLMNGRLDETALYSRALTSGEITRLYNAGAGCANPFTACP